MIAYDIRIPLLVCKLHTAHTHVTQPWYADNTGAGGTFVALHDHTRELLVRGPLRGYFPEPTKSILVVSLQNFQQEEAHLQGMGVRVVTRRCYLFGFIGDQESDKAWLEEKVEGWTRLVDVLAGVAHRYPQTAYADLGKSLQKEWYLVQHFTPHIRKSSHPAEEALGKSFLPALLKGTTAEFLLIGTTCLTAN